MQPKARTKYFWHVLHYPIFSVFCRYLESMTLHPRSDSADRCIFTWGTFLWSFIPIRFETTEPWAFVQEVAPTTRIRRRTRWVATWDQFRIKKLISNITYGSSFRQTNPHNHFLRYRSISVQCSGPCPDTGCSWQGMLHSHIENSLQLASIHNTHLWSITSHSKNKIIIIIIIIITLTISNAP